MKPLILATLALEVLVLVGTIALTLTIAHELTAADTTPSTLMVKPITTQETLTVQPAVDPMSPQLKTYNPQQAGTLEDYTKLSKEN